MTKARYMISNTTLLKAFGVPYALLSLLMLTCTNVIQYGSSNVSYWNLASNTKGTCHLSTVCAMSLMLWRWLGDSCALVVQYLRCSSVGRAFEWVGLGDMGKKLSI